MDIHVVSDKFPSLTFQQNVPLSPLTYMKVGGSADVFVDVQKTDDLFALCSFCFQNKIPFVILGGASNIIVPDEGIHKLVIKNSTSDVTLSPTENGDVAVYASSGVLTAVLANKTMDQGLSGLEYFVGVPGTIGGAIYNNSHYTAHELIGNIVTSVDVCTVSGKRETWNVDTLKFDYDYSVFHTQPDVILSATFRLKKDDVAKIRERVLIVAKRRADTQPIGTPSSGCMYKNPSLTESQLKNLELIVEVPQTAIKKITEDRFNVAAGFLIDSAGLKRTTVGGAQVSEKHATFLINTGTATAKDVEDLCQKIEKAVFEKYQIKLEREVFFLPTN
jgi:UDP-N-acetylmuramate dehydrogenase